MCLCIAHGIASVLELCLICRPLSAQWNPLGEGVCGDQMASFTAIEVSGLVLDLAILVFPILILRQPVMRITQKCMVICVIDSGAL